MSSMRSKSKSDTSVGVHFDGFAESYAESINKSAGLKMSGESFEFFIEYRISIMQQRLAVLSMLPKQATLLDFGCGVGATESVLRRRFPEARIHGVDPSAESVREAEALGLPNVRFHVASGTNRLPFEDGSVDLVYSNGTFHHIDHAEHAAVFRELHRVTRPGGKVFIFENNPLNPLVVYAMKTDPVDVGTRTLFPWYLRRLFLEAGFEVHGVDFYVFFPKALKPLRDRESWFRKLPFGGQYVVWGSKRGP